MLTDARTGRFITQRQVPRLALTKVTIDLSSNTLGLSAPTTSTLHLALNPRDADLSSQYKVRVWYDDVYGSSSSEAAQKWLTAFRQQKTRLVPRYLPGDPTCHLLPQSGFADVFPFHTITEPSLSHVNQHVALALTHQRFRPNIVLAARDAHPYDEETWKRMGFEEPGEKTWSMFVTSRTPRCTMPNVNLSSG